MSGGFEDLMRLKYMTVETGAIHELQKLNLKCYPLLINGVKSAEVSIDTDKKRIVYSLTTAQRFRKLSKKNISYYKNIEEWVKKILWNETEVVFIINGEVIECQT